MLTVKIYKWKAEGTYSLLLRSICLLYMYALLNTRLASYDHQNLTHTEEHTLSNIRPCSIYVTPFLTSVLVLLPRGSTQTQSSAGPS